MLESLKSSQASQEETYSTQGRANTPIRPELSELYHPCPLVWMRTVQRLWNAVAGKTSEPPGKIWKIFYIKTVLLNMVSSILLSSAIGDRLKI